MATTVKWTTRGGAMGDGRWRRLATRARTGLVLGVDAAQVAIEGFRSIADAASTSRREGDDGDVDDDRYCSGDGSGVTELFSNATRIEAAETEDPRPWLLPIASGNGRLLTFLHETTHHWCFTAPMVNAQVQVLLRAQMNAEAFVCLHDRDLPEDLDGRDELGLLAAMQTAMFGPAVLGPSDRPDELQAEFARGVARDLAVLDGVAAVFRPLHEGLALFAEYDAVSRLRSRAWSPLPLAVRLNFLGREALERERTVEPVSTTLAVGRALSTARLSPAAVRRKASLLQRPFRVADRGYLMGYLAVKSCWRHLCHVDDRLYGESDLALAYIRWYFLGDPVLATLLLEGPDRDPLADIETVAQRFQQRLRAFEDVTAADVEAFEGALADGTAAVPGLGWSPDEAATAIARCARAVEEYEERSSAARVVPDMAWRTARVRAELTEGRSWLTLCSVAVAVRSSADGLVVEWRGEAVLQVEAPDVVALPDGAGESFDAVLDVVLGTGPHTGYGRFAVVTADRATVSCSAIGPLGVEPGRRDALLRATTGRENRLGATAVLRHVTERVLDGDVAGRYTRQFLRDHIDAVVLDLYRDTALWWSRDTTGIDRAAGLLADRGLLTLLGTTAAVKRAALLGLAASIDSREESLRAVFAAHGQDLDTAMREIDSCHERHGFPPRILRSSGEEPLVIPFL